MDYKIELETFRGPLDLLLYLVKKEEVDICDIPIARIAQQFQDYLNLLHLVDIEWAGEFLLMAATLMEIKSRLLLPRQEETEQPDDDPRLELVKQLIEYKKYKEAAVLLEEKAEKQLTRMQRQAIERPEAPDLSQQPLRRVELWDLVSAFGRLVRETQAAAPKQIAVDDTPQQVHMDRILERLAHQTSATFRELFAPPHTRGRMLGIFLAILELIRWRNIVAEQSEAFGDIEVRLAPPSDEAEAAAIADVGPGRLGGTP
ncbi:MAG: segregation/condensation protein A [Gemmataceae bacterium]|nr:segregation/condensation protein A [Gemmataceae bacterium]